MIRKLLIATGVVAAVAITACSGMTDPTEMQSTGLAGRVSFVEASTCPAPGGGRPGALNMLHDLTMPTIPMTHDAAQGNAGMGTAVGASGC